jgi:uncharacterized membrane protein (DUF485 family)
VTPDPHVELSEYVPFHVVFSPPAPTSFGARHRAGHATGAQSPQLVSQSGVAASAVPSARRSVMNVPLHPSESQNDPCALTFKTNVAEGPLHAAPPPPAPPSPLPAPPVEELLHATTDTTATRAATMRMRSVEASHAPTRWAGFSRPRRVPSCAAHDTARAPRVCWARMKDDELEALAARRTRIAVAMTAVMLVTYFGFLLLIAYDKAALGALIVPGLSVGILLGALVIVVAWVVTGVYVRWANRVYDVELANLRKRGEEPKT